MNCEKEVYVDMNEVINIFHSFDKEGERHKDTAGNSNEHLNLVDEIINEFNLIESNMKLQYNSNKNYKEKLVTPFECGKSNHTCNNSVSAVSSKETKENGGVCKLNYESYNEQFTIVKGSSCCINGSNSVNKCCCVVDIEKITQLIELVNALHTKLNETNNKLNALQFQRNSFSKVNFPSENRSHFTNNDYIITSNPNISYNAMLTQPDNTNSNNNNAHNTSNSNKQKRLYNDALLFNANYSKKQQPITSFLHKQFKNK